MSSAPLVDGVSAAHRNIINGAYAYVEKSKETKHMAAAVAYLYNSALYTTCPVAAPQSSICTDPRTKIPMHFNSPLGMKYLNSMLRHAFNFFKGHENNMNWNDTEALAEPQNKIYFYARTLRKKLEITFSTLSGADGPSPSNTKVKAASHLFRLIEEYIRYPPRTLGEVRLADAGDAFARRAAHRPCGGAGCADDAGDDEETAAAAAASALPVAAAAAVEAVAVEEPATASAAVASPRALDVIRGMGLEYFPSGRNYQIKRLKNRADEPLALAELAKCGDCTVEVIPRSSPRNFSVLCVVVMN